MSTAEALAAINKTITVDASVETAFETFTRRMAAWWPTGSHRIFDDSTVVFEERAGGRVYERTGTGEEGDWADVLVWEPPHRLVFTWHPGRGEETSQEVEIRFTQEGDGTRIDLEHRGWERLVERAEEMIRGYQTGWDYVLGECYAGATKAA